MPASEPSGNERQRQTIDKSGGLSSEDTSNEVGAERSESRHWSGWYYGIYLGAALLVAGAIEVSLALLLPGYLLVPIAMYFDSRYVESVTPRWQRDPGLYVLGSLLFPVLMIPIYLYRRREIVG